VLLFKKEQKKKTKKYLRSGEVSSVIEHLPSMCEALSSILGVCVAGGHIRVEVEKSKFKAPADSASCEGHFLIDGAL
jgi:hypothetical protein